MPDSASISLIGTGRGRLAAVRRPFSSGADHDLGPAPGQHAPDQGLTVGMGMAGLEGVPPAVGAVGHATQRALLVDDVHREPVGE